MRQVTKTVFNFDELSDAAKEKARDDYRSNGRYEGWHEGVYEDARECALPIGIRIDEIWFSGFSSQGDGACFEGTWSARDVKPGELKEHAPQDAELHRIAAEFERIASCRPESSFTVKHSGHYYHKYDTEFSVDLGETHFDTLVEPCNPEFLQGILDQHEKDLIEAARDFMDWIYDSLRKQDEYLDSDEAVDESIVANEYEFDEDGDLQ
jgi:hypothetical protein